MEASSPLENIVFPYAFTFRLVADSAVDLEETSARRVREVLGRDIDGRQVQPSANGRYSVVRIQVRVENADEIRAVYAALSGLPGLRMLL